jgi:hypothetical protein
MSLLSSVRKGNQAGRKQLGKGYENNLTLMVTQRKELSRLETYKSRRPWFSVSEVFN